MHMRKRKEAKEVTVRSLYYKFNPQWRAIRDDKPEDYLVHRARIKYLINRHKFLHDGKEVVAIVYGGMDCDCTTMENMTLIDANVMRFVTNRDDFIHDEWTRPYYRIATEQDYNEYERPASRDLALDAYENGHPGYISY